MKTIVTMLSCLIVLPLMSLASTEAELFANSSKCIENPCPLPGSADTYTIKKELLFEGLDPNRVFLQQFDDKSLKLSIFTGKRPHYSIAIGSTLTSAHYILDPNDRYKLANAKLNNKVVDIYESSNALNGESLCSRGHRKLISIVTREPTITDNALREINEENEQLKAGIKALKKELLRVSNELKESKINIEIQFPSLPLLIIED